MRILITGASGFIGGFLVEEALRQGYEIWVGIRTGSDRSRLQDKSINFIDLKYSDIEALTDQLKNFVEKHGAWDYIVHNAGLTKTPDKKRFFQVNADYTGNLMQALIQSGCSPKKFLLMSSLSSYGPGDEKTFSPLSLSAPQHPDTSYGQSKLAGENHVRGQKHFPYIILRPTGVYGPGEKDYFMAIKSIQSGFDFAVGSVPQRITFIYVKDLARVVFMALQNKGIQNKEYFVADEDVHTDSSFARLVQELLGKKRVLHARIPLSLVYIVCLCSEWIGKIANKSMTLNSDKYTILKQRNWICDTTPLKDDLGFIPHYPLRKGLEESIAWYREKGWL